MRRYLMLSAFVVSCVSRTDWGHATVVLEPSTQARTIPVAVRKEGFVPHDVAVQQGEVVTLVFTREVAHTCVKRVVVSLDDKHSIERDLPRGVPVAITFRFDRPGELMYSCAMAMVGGTIRVAAAPTQP